MTEEMPEEEPVSDEAMDAEYTEGMHMQDELDLKEIIRELEGDLMEEDDELEMPEEDPYAVVPEGHEYGHDDDENIDEIIEAILREHEEEMPWLQNQ
jgi:hypothetical protein